MIKPVYKIQKQITESKSVTIKLAKNQAYTCINMYAETMLN